MRAIITVSQALNTSDIVNRVMLDVDWNITTLLSFGRDQDEAAEQWAVNNRIDVKRISAGSKSTNGERPFLHDIDGVIAIWDGTDRSTKHLIDIAIFQSLELFIYEAPQKTAAVTVVSASWCEGGRNWTRK